MNRSQKKYEADHYEAQGFVEALIAILITGIAAVGLMTVAAYTIRQVVDNEISDQLTQEAVKGAAILDYFVEEWNEGNRDFGTNMLVDGTTFRDSIAGCFAVDGDLASPSISNEMPSSCRLTLHQQSGEYRINPYNCTSDWGLVSIDSTGPDDYRDTMFRIACVSPESDSSDPYYVMVTKIFTGTIGCADDDYDRRFREISGPDETCELREHTIVQTVQP